MTQKGENLIWKEDHLFNLDISMNLQIKTHAKLNNYFCSLSHTKYTTIYQMILHVCVCLSTWKCNCTRCTWNSNICYSFTWPCILCNRRCITNRQCYVSIIQILELVATHMGHNNWLHNQLFVMLYQDVLQLYIYNFGMQCLFL
jgi:hypothetical protein